MDLHLNKEMILKTVDNSIVYEMVTTFRVTLGMVKQRKRKIEGRTQRPSSDAVCFVQSISKFGTMMKMKSGQNEHKSTAY